MAVQPPETQHYAALWDEPTITVHDLQGGEVRILDTLDDKDGDVNDLPILLSSGWKVPIERSFPIINALRQRGRRVITVDHSRLSSKNQPAKVEALRFALAYTAVAQADVVGYCEDAINSAHFTENYSDSVNSLILFNPAGLTGRGTFPRIAAVHARKMIVNSFKMLHRSNTNLPPSVQSFIASPAGAIADLYHMSRANVSVPLDNVERSGTPIGIIQCNHDDYFPPNRTTSQLAGHALSGYAMFCDPDAKHSAFSTNPEDAARMILEMICDITSSRDAV